MCLFFVIRKYFEKPISVLSRGKRGKSEIVSFRVGRARPEGDR
jgi:hypothetical protein